MAASIDPLPKITPLRVAYFPDSFHEVNGVANTSRHFEAFARRRELPFLCVRAGSVSVAAHDGPITTLELRRGPLTLPVEKDLGFDAAFGRHLPRVREETRRFRPDIIHITGPSELGLLGAYVAHQLHVPLAASWHTNIHEYAASRAGWLTHSLVRYGPGMRAVIERATLRAMAFYYRRAQMLFAPNDPLCEMLEATTGRPCHLMQRGVDTEAFSPVHRTRHCDDTDFVLGFVGRLSVEKNVSLLIAIAEQLRKQRTRRFRMLIVGQGAEEDRLRAYLPDAEFAGVLRGRGLARAYADMDAFVFPSHTDTFGNVVLEALASGVPAIVTPDGGPACIVREGETGLIRQDNEFATEIEALAADPKRYKAMQQSARRYALTASWDAVFTRVYAQYRILLAGQRATGPREVLSC